MDDDDTKFDPRRHYRTFYRSQKIPGTNRREQVEIKYLDTKWRVVWFRLEHPEGEIHTELLTDPAADKAVVKATVRYRNGEDWHECTGHARSDPDDWSDFIEKAETAAIGRALALAGYGTQFAEELDHDEKLADSPTELDPGALLEAPQVEKLVEMAQRASLDAEGLANLIEGKYRVRDPHELTVAQGREVGRQLAAMAKADQDGGEAKNGR